MSEEREQGGLVRFFDHGGRHGGMALGGHGGNSVRPVATVTKTVGTTGIA